MSKSGRADPESTRFASALDSPTCTRDVDAEAHHRPADTKVLGGFPFAEVVRVLVEV